MDLPKYEDIDSRTQLLLETDIRTFLDFIVPVLDRCGPGSHAWEHPRYRASVLAQLGYPISIGSRMSCYGLSALTDEVVDAYARRYAKYWGTND